MTLKDLPRWFGDEWVVTLLDMLADGFIICEKCGGLPFKAFKDAHDAGCRKLER